MKNNLFMQSQFFSLSICTKGLMTNEELVLNNLKTETISKINKLKLFESDNQDEVDKNKKELVKHKEQLKSINKDLLELLDRNICLTRNLTLKNYYNDNPKFKYNEEYMIFTKRISLFENALSRAIGVGQNEFTDAIITIRVFHNSILKSLINNGFVWSGNKYILYTCGASALRTRKSTWIREDVYLNIRNKLFNSLEIEDINTKGGHYSNKILAYRALPMSSSIKCDWFDIRRVCVIPDVYNTVVSDVDKINTQSMQDKHDEQEKIIEINKLIDKINTMKLKSLKFKEMINSGDYEKNECKAIRKERTLCNKELESLKHKKRQMIKDLKEWKRNLSVTWDTVSLLKNNENEIAIGDGVGLIRPKIRIKLNEEIKTIRTTNFVCRMPWTKGLIAVYDFEKMIDVFQRDKQKYISKENGKEYTLGKYEVIDIWGDVVDIRNVDIILTGSQLKAWNFYDSMDDYATKFENNNCEFSIANMEELNPSNRKKITYQMLQSLGCVCTIEDIEEIADTAFNNIKNIGRDEKSMLHVLGADKPQNLMSWQQKAFNLYPELLTDNAIKEQLKSTKKSLVESAIGGHFELGNAYYPYLIPDLFALCQIAFSIPKLDDTYGLLKGDEVYCSLFEDEEELVVDRNPALYFEHFYTNNAKKERVKDWFKTKGLYCSTNSMMSMILVNDYDGDTGLISNNKRYVGKVKQHIETYGRPALAYNLQKADKTIIDNDVMYKGITSAYNANIGEISNRISILWNSLKNTSSEIAKKLTLYCIKVECAYNNQTIDYAKNLFLSEKTNKLKKIEEIVMNEKVDVVIELLGIEDITLEDLIDIIDKGIAHEILSENGHYLKAVGSIKVPYFFTNVKKYSVNKVSELNDSLVNSLRNIVPDERIYFEECVKGEFDWKNLLSGKSLLKDIPNDKKLIKRFNYLHEHKQDIYNSMSEDDKNKNINVNLYIVNELMKTCTEEFKEPKDKKIYILDVLVKYLYKNHHEEKMNTLWNCLGKILYENLEIKLKNTKRCEVCGKRFNYEQKVGKPEVYCVKCKRIKELERKRKWENNQRK